MKKKKVRVAGYCAWTFDLFRDSVSWDTGCGEKFQFTEGGPGENRFKFCPYCGAELMTYINREDRAAFKASLHASEKTETR